MKEATDGEIGVAQGLVQSLTITADISIRREEAIAAREIAATIETKSVFLEVVREKRFAGA